MLVSMPVAVAVMAVRGERRCTQGRTGRQRGSSSYERGGEIGDRNQKDE